MVFLPSSNQQIRLDSRYGCAFKGQPTNEGVIIIVIIFKLNVKTIKYSPVRVLYRLEMIEFVILGMYGG